MVIPDTSNPSTPLYSNLNVDDSTTPTTLTISNARALGLEGSHAAEVRHCNAAGGCSLPLNITFTLPAPPTATVFQFTPSPLALGGTSNVWTIPTGVTSVYVDVDFSEGIYKDSDAGDINVNRVNSFGTVLSTLAVENEDDSRTWTGAVDGSLIRIDVDNDAFDVSRALVTLTFHSGSDTTGPEIARATVQKESRPYAPTNGSASVDETNGSVTLSWGPGAARLGSNPDHYEVVIPDATNPSTPLYSNLNVDDSTTPTTLTISNARALGLEGSHKAEVRHCNAAGGCSLPLNITFMVTPSIALLGVGASLEVDASDQFSVSVRRLNPSHNYLIRVVYTTSHIAEGSGCLGGSTNTIRNFSGSTTFYLSTFNVYGCSAGTSTITANLHRVISGVEQVSSLATAVAPVSVITPNPPAAPTDLTGGVGDRGISLSWPAPSGTVTGYKVQRRVDTIGTSFSTITTLNGKDSTTHTDGDAALVEGTSYLYRVIAFNSGGDSQPSDDVTVSFKIITSEWNVLDYRYVLIDWLLPSNQRTTGHQFRFGILRTGGADAGFQIYPATATNARKCNWSSPPSDYTSWSNLGTAFYVVRCKLGTGNGHIELQRIPDSGSSRPITSILTIGPVKQSWHRADHQVGYLVDSPFMDGAKPGHLPAAYTVNEATSTTAMSDAASAWNAGQTYVTFEVVTTTPDTTIRGYWNPYGTSLNDKCKGSIACVYGGGEYPELEHQQFWIEFPPRFPGDGDYKEWTNDIAEVRQMPDDFYYLPQVIMHEFGHTAGLGHTLVGDVMGPIYSRDPLSGPTSYDLNGITNIYQNHTRHQEGTQ